MTLPNFIIIGAAKAGTTALYWYLAGHPEVFMSAVKETNWFAYATDDRGRPVYGDSRLHHFPVKSASAYENLFRDAGDAIAIGEASPIYLECPSSAARIHASVPDARIICGLRNPVDRAYSDYLMYLRGRGERLDPEDLAVTADWMRADSHWMRVSRYHDALRRYYALFPRERIHVFRFDDLKRSPRGMVRDVYRFLGIDAEHVPDFATPYNVGGMPANALLERLFTSGAAIRTTIEPWLPKGITRWARRLRASNMQKAPRLPADARRHLMAHFRDDILRTMELTGIDLRDWLEQGETARAELAVER